MEPRTKRGQSPELPNEPRLLPNRGQGDLRLTREGGGRMVLRRDRVEIGNSGYDRSSPENYDEVNRDQTKDLFPNGVGSPCTAALGCER
jgi:hypothetical protein